MKWLRLSILCLALSAVALFADETLMLRQPHVHGDQVVFVYGGSTPDMGRIEINPINKNHLIPKDGRGAGDQGFIGKKGYSRKGQKEYL